MTARNPHEALARAEKTARLVRHIDRGIPAGTPANEIAAYLRSPERTDEWWAAVARASGLIGKNGRVLVPSTLTRECVAMEYDARAEELGHAIDSAFDRLDDAAVDERWE